MTPPPPQRPRRRTSRRLLPLLVLAALPACVEFTDPEIPQAGAPATLQVLVSVFGEETVQVSAVLTPGYDSLGVPRSVTDPTLRVQGRTLAPTVTAGDDRRVYADSWPADGSLALGPVVVDLPVVAGAAPPETPRWHGMRRVGPDTLDLHAGDDLVLELEVHQGGTASVQQWFLQMTGADGSVRVSADGPPPERLVVPAVWVPPPRDDGTIRVTLTYAQSEARVGPGGRYVLSGAINILTGWVVRVEAAG